MDIEKVERCAPSVRWARLEVRLRCLFLAAPRETPAAIQATIPPALWRLYDKGAPPLGLLGAFASTLSLLAFCRIRFLPRARKIELIQEVAYRHYKAVLFFLLYHCQRYVASEAADARRASNTSDLKLLEALLDRRKGQRGAQHIRDVIDALCDKLKAHDPISFQQILGGVFGELRALVDTYIEARCNSLRTRSDVKGISAERAEELAKAKLNQSVQRRNALFRNPELLWALDRISSTRGTWNAVVLLLRTLAALKPKERNEMMALLKGSKREALLYLCGLDESILDALDDIATIERISTEYCRATEILANDFCDLWAHGSHERRRVIAVGSSHAVEQCLAKAKNMVEALYIVGDHDSRTRTSDADQVNSSISEGEDVSSDDISRLLIPGSIVVMGVEALTPDLQVVDPVGSGRAVLEAIRTGSTPDVTVFVVCEGWKLCDKVPATLARHAFYIGQDATICTGGHELNGARARAYLTRVLNQWKNAKLSIVAAAEVPKVTEGIILRVDVGAAQRYRPRRTPLSSSAVSAGSGRASSTSMTTVAHNATDVDKPT